MTTTEALKPLVFFDIDNARRWVKNHVCSLGLCDYHLVESAPGVYQACCEHGPAMAHNNISRARAQALDAERRYYTYQLDIQPTGKSPEEILRDLGF